VGGWWLAASNSALSLGGEAALALCPAAGALIVARRWGRDEAVVAAAVASVTAGLLVFIGYVATTYATSVTPATPALLREFASSGAHNYRGWAIGDDLAGAVVLLLYAPVIAMAFGYLPARRRST
jgi:hypothetical protein